MNRNAVYALLDQAAVSITGFLTGVFIARILGVEAFGAYVLANGTYLFINAFQQALILSPVSVYASGSDTKVSEYLHSTRLLQAAFSATASIMFAALAYILSKTSSNTAVQSAFLLMSPLAFFLLSQEFSRQVLIARRSLQTLLLVDVTAKLSTLLLLAALTQFASGYQTLTSVFGALILSAALGSALGWWHAKRFMSRSTELLPHWTRNYQFGKWAVISQLAVMATSQIPIYILALSAGTADTGIYGAAVNLTGIFHVFLNGIANYYLPLGVKQYESGGPLRLRGFTRSLSLKFGFVIVPISLLCLVFAEQIVRLVYDDAFLSHGATPFQVFFCVAILLAFIKPLDIAMRIREQMKKRASISFAELIFVGIASLPLIYALGVVGGAIAAVGGRAIALIAMFNFVRIDLPRNTAP